MHLVGNMSKLVNLLVCFIYIINVRVTQQHTIIFVRNISASWEIWYLKSGINELEYSGTWHNNGFQIRGVPNVLEECSDFIFRVQGTPKKVLFVDLLNPVDGRNILVPNIRNYLPLNFNIVLKLSFSEEEMFKYNRILVCVSKVNQ